MKRIKNTLGIDIGGTSIKAGFLPGPGPSVSRWRARPTPKTLKDIWALLVDIIIDYGSRYHLEAIGVGCPGPLDIKNGIIVNTPHLPFKNLPLKKFLELETRLPVALDNDANALVLAEATWGAGKKYQNVIGLTLGTGLGGGIIINKKIYHGRGNAGELGYLLLTPQGSRGKLGDKGAAQELIHAGRLLRNALNQKINAGSVESLARNHSSAAQSIWNDYGNKLGYIIVSLCHTLDPDVVVLGGQISQAWPRFAKAMQKTIQTNCIFSKPPLIKKAALGQEAGVIGAALLTTQFN